MTQQQKQRKKKLLTKLQIPIVFQAPENWPQR